MKFEMRFFDGKDIQKIVVEGSAYVAEEIHKVTHLNRERGLDVKGVVLGPEEYLGLVGFLANQQGVRTQAEVNKIGGIEQFIGYPIFLKDTPGIEFLYDNHVGMAAKLIHNMPKFEVKK